MTLRNVRLQITSRCIRVLHELCMCNESIVYFLLFNLFYAWGAMEVLWSFLRVLLAPPRGIHHKLICALACWRDTQLLSATMRVECHRAYNTLSHAFIFFFYILGGVKFTYVVSTTRCIYTCPAWSGMRPRPPPEVVWAIEFKSI